MTPYERVRDRLAGKPVDKVPNLNILMAFAAKYIGRTMDSFCTDYACLVEANIKANERFGIDMLNTMSDAYRETYDFGAEVVFPPDGLPVCKSHLIRGPADIPGLKLFDPLRSTRMLDRIRAVELYNKEAGDHYPILGWVEGSFAEAADLMGVTELMLALYDEPEAVKELLSICCEEGILCAREQVRAGADFIGVGDAAASLVSPDIYREFALLYEKKLIGEIHLAGAKVKLHICGNIGHILDDIRHSGADIIDIDYPVDFRTAVEKFDGYPCSANGNFEPVKVLYSGSPETVRQAVSDCLAAADAKTFISAGCEVPRDTPYENLEAVDETLRRLSQS